MSRAKSGSMGARLSSKIVLAMGSVLFLFALVLGLFYYIVMMQSPGSSQSSVQIPLLAEQMKTSLMDAQKNESLFLLLPQPEPISRHKAAVTQLLSFSQQLTQLAQQNGDNASAATAISLNNSIQQLNSAFVDVVQARETKGVNGSPGLLEKLDKAGQQLEEAVSRNEAGNLALAFLRIQRYEHEYFKTGKPVELQNLRETIKNFSRLLMDTKIEPVEAQTLRKAIKEYNLALDRYQAVSLATNDYMLSATLSKEKGRQTEAMRIAADKIASAINRVNVPDALHMMLVIRQHEDDYLLTADMKSAQLVNESLDTLINTFNTSSILQEHKNQVLKESIAYRDAFMAVVNQNTALTDLVARLNETATSLENLISTIVKSTSTTPAGNTLSSITSANNLGMIGVIAGLAVILIGVLVAIFLGKSISAPIIGMITTVRRINSSNDFSIEIPVVSKNETGILAQELNSLLRKQEATFGQTDEATSGLSEKLETLGDISRNLQQHLKTAVKAADTISGSAKRQNELADKMNRSVSVLSASAVDMNQMFSQSDEQNQLITDAVEHIGRSVESTVEGIKAITTSSSQISEIITLSTELAEQTSLLALNASVKAARAGSHGKEFAVIADEIAKLAQRSEELAKEAGELTASLNSKVDEAIKLGDDSRKSLDQVHEAGRLNLLTAEELAKQAAVINTSTEELGKLAENLAATISEIESTAEIHTSESTAALESIAKIVGQSPGPDEETEDEDDNPDASLKKAMENISITLSEKEEDEFISDHTDETASAEETGGDDHTEFGEFAADKEDTPEEQPENKFP